MDLFKGKWSNLKRLVVAIIGTIIVTVAASWIIDSGPTVSYLIRSWLGSPALSVVINEVESQDDKGGDWVELYNPGPRTITGFQAAVDYLSGQRLIYTDTECGGTTSISPGNVGHLGCYKKAVPGAFSWQIRLVDIGVE